MRWILSMWACLCTAVPAWAAPLGGSPTPWAMAVLGDSDSHGYHDTLAFPSDPVLRGGRFQSSTHQWTEVLDLLRKNEIDLGERQVTGTSGRWSRVLEAVGFDARSPRKRDHLHNFAYSGTGCADLWSGNRQVPRLLRLMDQHPTRWQRGVVLIRIGNNTLGMRTELARLAQRSDDATVRFKMDACASELTRAVQAIRVRHPGTRIVLVSVFNNANWSKYLHLWTTSAEVSRIAQGLDHYNSMLRRLAASDPHIAYFDDDAWFASLWGTRAPGGQPAYRPLDLGGTLQVTNTTGNEPWHATLQDGHAGAVWNAKWAQSLVNLLNTSFQLGLTPIHDDEVRRLVAPGGRWPAPPIFSTLPIPQERP